MCPRRDHGGPLLPGLTPTSIDLATVRNWIEPELIRHLRYVVFCGNLGDPIMAADLVPIILYLRESNPRLGIGIHTNGSARPRGWWTALAHTGAKVVFALDGLADTHARYRRGTNWQRIIDNAATFIAAGGSADWHMLIFRHNEHQIEHCRALAREMGFAAFIAKDTTRFSGPSHEVWDEVGRVVDRLYPSQRSVGLLPAVLQQIDGRACGISCQTASASQLFIAADGTVAPCCYLDLTWYPEYWPERVDYAAKMRDVFPNLRRQTLAEIFDSGFFDGIAATWLHEPLRTCAVQCGGGFTRRKAEYR